MDSQPAAARALADAADADATILVADDDRNAREHLAALLRSQGYQVEVCEDGQEALSRVTMGGIDLVLLDAVMPRLSGSDTCRLLKSLSGTTFLPVMFVTSRSDPASRVEGLRLGADDYLGKPFDNEELLARVDALLRIKRLVATVAEERDRLQRRTVHDELTGLPNRRLFEMRLVEERKRAERYHEPFACLVLSIVVGNGARDLIAGGNAERVVTRAAAAMKRSVREGDVVARIASTTLAAILTHTHFAGTLSASERIFRDVSGAIADPAVVIGIGASLFPSRDARTAESLLLAAQSALDECWERGGGQICILQQRKYLYTPGTAPRSERPPPSTRAIASEPPPSVRRGPSEPPPSVRRGPSEPPLRSESTAPRDNGDRKG
ncbi:MAG: response regulator [Polyangiaceae bacterium]|nr:response regulator [Polyangiaceae bacterium]